MTYYAHFQGDTYATQFFPVVCNSIKELRSYIRIWLGVSRLPNGTEVWINK